MKKQLGFTLHEVIVVIALLFSLALTGALIYAAVHFIAKFW